MGSNNLKTVNPTDKTGNDRVITIAIIAPDRPQNYWNYYSLRSRSCGNLTHGFWHSLKDPFLGCDDSSIVNFHYTGTWQYYCCWWCLRDANEWMCPSDDKRVTPPDGTDQSIAKVPLSLVSSHSTRELNDLLINCIVTLSNSLTNRSIGVSAIDILIVCLSCLIVKNPSTCRNVI